MPQLNSVLETHRRPLGGLWPLLLVSAVLLSPAAAQGRQIAQLEVDRWADAFVDRLRTEARIGEHDVVVVLPMQTVVREDNRIGARDAARGSKLCELLEVAIARRLPGALRGPALEAELNRSNLGLSAYLEGSANAEDVAVRASASFAITASLSFDDVTAANPSLTVALQATPRSSSRASVFHDVVVENRPGNPALKALYELNRKPPAYRPGGFRPTPEGELYWELIQVARASLAQLKGAHRGPVGILPSYGPKGEGPSRLQDLLVESLATELRLVGSKVSEPAAIETIIAQKTGLKTLAAWLDMGDVDEELLQSLGLTALIKIEHGAPPKDENGRTGIAVRIASRRETPSSATYSVGSKFSRPALAQAVAQPGRSHGACSAGNAVHERLGYETTRLVRRWAMSEPRSVKSLQVWQPLFERSLGALQRYLKVRGEWAAVQKSLLAAAKQKGVPSDLMMVMKWPVTLGGKTFPTPSRAYLHLSELGAAIEPLVGPEGRLHRSMIFALLVQPGLGKFLLPNSQQRSVTDLQRTRDIKRAIEEGTIDPDAFVPAMDRFANHILTVTVDRIPTGAGVDDLAFSMQILDARSGGSPSAAQRFIVSGFMARAYEKAVAGPGRTASAAPRAPTLPELYERYCKGIVFMRVGTPKGAFLGTGWLIGRDLVVTNRHVIKPNVPGKVQITAQFRSGLVLAGRTIAYSNRFDIAVVKLAKQAPEGAHIFSIGDRGHCRIGTEVLSIGHPAPGQEQAKKFTLGRGLVTNDRVQTPPNHSVLYDIATFGGSSGSPVFTRDGTVVALHFRGSHQKRSVFASKDGPEGKAVQVPDIFTSTKIQGFNLGVPADALRSFLDSKRIPYMKAAQ